MNSLLENFTGSYLTNLQLQDTDSSGLFIYILVSRLAVFFIAVLIIYFVKHVFPMYVLTIYFGTAFGIVISLLTMIYGTKSYLYLIGMMFPHYLIFIPMYIFAIKAAQNYKNHRIQMAVAGNGGAVKVNNYVVIIGIIAAAIIIGCLLESYVNPLFIKNFFKNF